MDLSLIIPCYRDAGHLERHVEEIMGVLDGTRFSYEIILVDDRRPDECLAIIDRLIAKHPEHRIVKIAHEVNSGRGGAVNDGLRAARGEVAGFLDIDLEVAAHYIPALVRMVRSGADVVVGHRIYKLRWRILHRAILSIGYHWMVGRVLGMKLGDTESGCKFFRRERILPVIETIEDSRWFWDTEVVVRSMVAGLKVCSMPVLFIRNPDKASTVKLVADSLDHIKNLWRFRRTLRRAGSPGPGRP